MTAAKILAIAAGAYNVCGPRSGTPATPATIQQMVNRSEMVRLLLAYKKESAADPLALHSQEEIETAICEVGGR